MVAHRAGAVGATVAAVASTPDDVVALHRRAALAARAAVPGREPPYFALLRVETAGRVRDVLLGRRSQMLGDLALVDWERSPLAEVFFSHFEGDEYAIDVDRRSLQGRVVLRHLVEFDGDEPCAIERESGTIQHGSTGWIEVPTARPVLAPRGDRQLSPGDAVMLDPTQRAAVELPAARPVLVLGEAGFGKTTVALHRIASLAAKAAARGRPFRGLVIVPSEALRRLSVLTLERLGATTLEVETFDEWVVAQARRVFVDLPKRLSVNTSPVVTRLKRHPALREVLPDIVAGTPAMKAVGRGYHESKGSRDALLHLFGDRDLLARVVEASAGALGPGAIAACVAHTRLQFTSTTEERYAHVDAERLATLDGRAIDDGTPMQDAGTMDVEDCAVLLELRHRAGDPAPSSARYDHIVVDEAQELAPIELAALGRALAPGGAATVAGDDAQQIDETVAFVGWPSIMGELGGQAHERVTLASSYRCPSNVERLARLVVGRTGAESPPRDAEAPIVWHRAASPCHLVSHTAAALTELRERDRRARIAIVCRHQESAERLYRQLERGFPVRLALGGDFDFLPGAIVTSVDEVRGLEFDHVIVPDASPGSYPEDPPARRALYVAMTRTMHQLWLVTPSVWSPLLRPHVGLGA
jgi:DNA helicase-2/ATP-dependent DNA helicase PcrA